MFANVKSHLWCNICFYVTTARDRLVAIKEPLLWLNYIPVPTLNTLCHNWLWSNIARTENAQTIEGAEQTPKWKRYQATISPSSSQNANVVFLSCRYGVRATKPAAPALQYLPCINTQTYVPSAPVCFLSFKIYAMQIRRNAAHWMGPSQVSTAVMDSRVSTFFFIQTKTKSICVISPYHPSFCWFIIFAFHWHNSVAAWYLKEDDSFQINKIFKSNLIAVNTPSCISVSNTAPRVK